MTTDWRSDWREQIVDLPFSDDDERAPIPIRVVAPKTPVPLPAITKPSIPIPPARPTPPTSTHPAQPLHTHLPVPEPRSRKSTPNTPSSQTQTQHATPPTANASRGAVKPAKNGGNIPVPSPHPPIPGSKHFGEENMYNSDRGTKRRKLSNAGGPTQVQGQQRKPKPPTASPMPLPVSTNNGSASRLSGGSTLSTRPVPAPSKLTDKSIFVNMGNKAPSVQYMNAALKTNGSNTTSLLDKIESRGPRPVQIGRLGDNGYLSTPEPKSATPMKQASMTSTQSTARVHDGSRDTVRLQTTTGVVRDIRRTHVSQQPPRISTPDATNVQARTSLPGLRNGSFGLPSFSGPIRVQDDDKDSVLSDASDTADQTDLRSLTQPTPDVRHSSAPTPTPAMVNRHPTPLKNTSAYSEEEEHLLIFLKEVKKLKWKLITAEFQKFYPTRVYHSIQTRYTTKTNKRDRSQDPAVLKLPPKWAGEAVIDWPSVHAGTSGPRECAEIANLQREVDMLKVDAPKPTTTRHNTDQDYSSGTDSGVSKRRARRTAAVNYDVRRHHRRFEGDMDDVDLGESFAGGLAGTEGPIQSQSAFKAENVVSSKAHEVVIEPLDMDFTTDDARIALDAVQRQRGSLSQKLPYLRAADRLSLQNAPANWEWDQISSRDWQGMLLHVDFTPAEVVRVERAIAKGWQTSDRSRHTTQRRHLRALLKGMTDPSLLKLAHSLGRCLPAREKAGIEAFLRDAQLGMVTDNPQVLRLSAARPRNTMSTVRMDSTASLLRQRELGLQSRRGWSAATTASTYQTRNKIMDTLGPSASWTGASSDIHTVAWSLNGECFAAGAVAVTDQDSMQYNRPNNLLFGDVTGVSIHELAEHSIRRKRTETGANSSHAMFVSQDPNLYTTVTSVAFAPSGKVMYSAGYDNSVCVWSLGATGTQPYLATKIRHKAEVELMVVNHSHPGLLATAAKRTSGNAVKLISLNEDDPYEVDKHDFHSKKATSRSDLNILPQALQFEPRYGELLLAGFGANARTDQGLDITGDLCIWNIETQTQIAIHGSNRNTFDVVFNPNRRYLPLFAAGCVANGTVNRGTRSVIRLYDERGPTKYTCPLEVECKALDMNEIVWSPQNENLMAVGCTDGRVYVWDLRNSVDPLRVLSHGMSLMPLQDDVPYERTDTGIRFLSWGDNATRLYSGSSDGVVKVWDVTRAEENTFVRDLITFDSGVMAGSFSQDNSRLVIGEVNGTVNVLDVGRDDFTIKDASKLQYIPYEHTLCEDDNGAVPNDAMTQDFGAAEGKYLLETGQLHLAPMGNLPTTQVVQGSNYEGPFDQSVDAPFLREKALDFQMSMAAKPGPQCTIPSCRDNMVKITSEEIGDSGRSADRIPDELRRQWTLIDARERIMPGKSKCTYCSRPARPSLSDDPNEAILCERCSFACLRCGAVNAIAPATTTMICDSCAGVWDIGALGYECVEEPASGGVKLDVPPLRRFGREMLEGYMPEERTTYGDEMNALTDHYFSLAIDRPGSPPL